MTQDTDTQRAQGLVERFDYEPYDPDEGPPLMKHSPFGKWVSYTDYAALSAENATLRAKSERWQQNMRDNHAAFAAMRNDLNELFQIQSDDADLHDGPELSVSCAAIVNAAHAWAAERRLAEQGQVQDEAVAWRYRSNAPGGKREWTVTQFPEDVETCRKMNFECEPLYLATPPSPDPDAELVRRLRWISESRHSEDADIDDLCTYADQALAIIRHRKQGGE